MPLDNPPGPVSQALLGKSPGAATPVASVQTPTNVPQTTPPPAASTPSPPAPDGSNPAPSDALATLNQQLAQQAADMQPVQMSMGPAPVPPMLAPPPPQPPANPGHAWGATAMVFGLLASSLTRHPLTSALNAGAQVMSTINTSAANSATAKQQYEIWKTQTTNALTLFKYQNDQYNEVWKNTTDSSKAQTGRLLALFSAFKDGAAYAAWQQGGNQGLMTFLAKRTASAASLAGQSNKLVLAQLEEQSWEEWQAANPPPSDPAEMPAYTQSATAAAKTIFSSGVGPGGTPLPILPDSTTPPSTTTGGGATTPPDSQSGTAATPSPGITTAPPAPPPASINLNALRISDPALYATAWQIAHYEASPVSSYSSSQGGGEKLMAAVQSINPDYDATYYPAIIKTRDAFTSGPESKSVTSFNVMLTHLDQLTQLSQALQNSDFRAVNQLSNQISVWNGGTAVTNFNAAKAIVADEVVKAILGSGTSALGDRDEAKAHILAQSSPQQLLGVIGVYKDLAAAQLQGLQTKYYSGTDPGDAGNNFAQRFLSPQSQRILGDMPPEGTPPPPMEYTPTQPGNGGSTPKPGSTLHYDAQGNLVQ